MFALVQEHYIKYNAMWCRVCLLLRSFLLVAGWLVTVVHVEMFDESMYIGQA